MANLNPLVGRCLALSALLALSACITPEGGDPLLTDEDIVARCRQWIGEIEDSSSAEQRAGLEEITRTVAEHDFSAPAPLPPPPPPPPDIVPYTLEPTGPPDLYRMFGTMAFLNGNLSAALWSTLQGLLETPSDPVLLAQAGTILIAMGRCEEAEAFLRRATAEDPTDDFLLMTLAEALRCRGRIPAAIRAVEQALQLAPDRPLDQQALMGLYLEEIPGLAELRGGVLASCSADIQEALGLSSSTDLDAFVLRKNEETSALTTHLMDLVMQLPPDLPGELLDGLDAANTRYLDRYTAGYATPLGEDLTALQGDLLTWEDQNLQLLAECCGDTECACTCFSEHCARSVNTLTELAYPNTFSAMDRFLPGSLRVFSGYELDLAGALYHHRDQTSGLTLDWAARYAYAQAAMQCKQISLEAAYALGHALRQRDSVDLSCGIEEECRTAAEEAYREAKRLEAEEALRLAAEEALRKVLAEVESLDKRFRGELCLGPVGCIGVDGGAISIKIGGGLFSQFTVDTDNLSLSVRIGVGISDPTGNAASADLTIGGSIGLGGSSLSVEHSQSLHFGTVRQNYVLGRIGRSF